MSTDVLFQLCCQPLDTIKVRMQLSKSGSGGVRRKEIASNLQHGLLNLYRQGKSRGFIATGVSIVQRETPLALYKGLGAVLSGIVPKMAIRFASFETYKKWLTNENTGNTSVGGVFVGTLVAPQLRYRTLTYFSIAGLAAGITEAVAVVTPMEVVKIRLQAQSHSLADPLEIPRYRNAAHAVYTIVREEGFATLYRGVTLTALRQATNQGG